jgi:hypothetical protein
MTIQTIGDTFKRHAHIGFNQSNRTYYVSYTDWTTRQGGSKAGISFRQAKFLANKFVNGCKYRFDSRVGIILEIEYKR